MRMAVIFAITTLALCGSVFGQTPGAQSQVKPEDALDSSEVQSTENLDEMLPTPPVEDMIWVDTSIVVSEVSLNGSDLRTSLLGLARAYNVNLFVEPNVSQAVTLNLRQVKFNDVLKFLANRYSLSIWRDGNIVTVGIRLPVPEARYTLEVRNDSVWLDSRRAPVGDLARALTKQSGLNFLVAPADSAQEVTGLIQGIPLVAGLEPLLAVNGMELSGQKSAFVISKVGEAGGPVRTGGRTLGMSDSGISLSVNREPLAKLVPSLLEKAGVNWFVYGDLPGTATADFKALSLDESLRRLLMGTEYSFTVQAEGYVIGPRKMEGNLVSQLFPLKYLVVKDVEGKLPPELLSAVQVRTIPEQNAIMALGPFGPVADVGSYLREIDQPVAQILIEILMVDYTDTFLREWKISVDNSGGASDDTPYDLLYPQVRVGDKATGVEREARNFLDDLGIKYVGGLPATWFVKLQALETEGKVKIQSRPAIATLSGHEASITVGTTQYYLLETETTYGVNQTSPTTQISRQFTTIEASMDVKVTPWVTGNGEVVVELTPSFRTPKGSFNADVPPTIDQRTLSSTVRLRDGETIVLGGLRQDAETHEINKFPVLGNIPILGRLFQNTSTRRENSELMIYITPKIDYGGEVTPDEETHY